jgi:thiol:disulfide interchange protein
MKNTGGTMSRIQWMTRGATLAAALAVTVAIAAPALAAGGDWNDADIKWMGYTEGLKEAKESGKPVCLIFYTTWCPHCTNYSKVFSDPRLVDKSKEFVMIRLDKDQNPTVSAEFKPDGEYIPRTYFLSPSGQLDESLTAGRPQYKYFYDESKADGLLAGMDRALERFKLEK